MVAMETLKSHVSVIIATVAKKKNASSKSRILYLSTATKKLSWLDKHLLRKNANLKNELWEKGPENTLFLHFMANFQNFDLETSRGERVVKPILGTRNSSDANMHVWFTHSLVTN